MISLFAGKKKNGKTQEKMPYQLPSSPQSGSVQDHSFEVLQREVRKKERNDFSRHRRDLEVKFNLSEIYSHQID